MRRLPLLAAVLAAAGCGAGSGARHPATAPILANAAPPPIAAVDEAPSPEALWFLQEQPSAGGSASSGTGTVCATTFSSDGTQSQSSDSCAPPSPAEEARLRAQQQRYEDALRPGPSSGPRLVARLSLAGGGRADFTAWRTGSGALCWEVEVWQDGGGGGGGPDGPCARAAEAAALSPALAGQALPGMPPCDALCLTSSGGGGAGGTTYVLSGTVPTDAEAIRVTVAGGSTATYPLLGPPLLDAGDRRIFMLDLGSTDWRRFELIRDGAVVRSVDMPVLQAASEDCSARLGPPPMASTYPSDPNAVRDAMRPYEQEMTDCVRAAGGLGSATATSP